MVGLKGHNRCSLNKTLSQTSFGICCGVLTPLSAAQTGIAQAQAAYFTAGRSPMGAGWHYISTLELPRRINDVFIEELVRQVLIRLNPTITD